MGKAIQKKWFGLATLPGSQIVVNGVKFADGTVATNAYIVKQTGSAAYVVQDTAKAHAPEIVFMVNANSTGALLPGQCYILATPFGGSALPCAKIAQYRVDIYNVANSVPTEVGAPTSIDISSYTWSTVPATAPGQADLIGGTGVGGAILTVVKDTSGFGYFTAPSISFNGGGNGATATASVANGAVTTLVLNAAGAGYTDGSMTISAPPTSVTATATATQTGGVVQVPVVTQGGGYYTTAPAVTITAGAGTGAVATAVLTAGRVTSITLGNAGTGYTTPVTVSIAAPAAATTATAHATISV